MGFPRPLTAVAENCEVWPGRSVPSGVVIWTAATAVADTGSLPPQPVASTASHRLIKMARITVTPSMWYRFSQNRHLVMSVP
jgi:hypothetical protein